MSYSIRYFLDNSDMTEVLADKNLYQQTAELCMRIEEGFIPRCVP